MTKVKFIRSGVLNKMPESSQLELGQLAINFNHLAPFIAIKTDDGNIFKFNPLNEWVGTQAQFDLIEYRNPNITYYITD